MSSDGSGSDSGLRAILLVLEPEPHRDPDETERSARRLRAELTELDVQSATPVISENVPAGAKGIDSSSLGTLLITLSATGGVFTTLIWVAQDWLARNAAARRISVTIDGDTIVLEKGSTQERSALIDAYIRRHEVK